MSTHQGNQQTSMQRPLEAVKADVLGRVGRQRPFQRVGKADVEKVLEGLTDLDRDTWAREWSKPAGRYETEGNQLLAEKRRAEAAKAYYQAYAFYSIARFPAPTTPLKMECYWRAVENFRKAAKDFEPAMEVVQLPFEGKRLTGYLQVPKGSQRPPVVMHWGGVDAWKEDLHEYRDAMLKAGLATLSFDMPGTGENPVVASDPTAERTFSAMIDHLKARSDVDGDRLGVLGASFGGYWATKLAFVESARIKAAVNHAGGVHYGFQKEWLLPTLTTRASYLLGPSGLLDARTYMMRVKTLEELLEIAPRMSLKNQALLDKPSAPLLAVNGKKDTLQTIDDVYILVEHGRPKAARVYPDGGHMGRTPGTSGDEVVTLIVEWLKEQLLS